MSILKKGELCQWTKARGGSALGGEGSEGVQRRLYQVVGSETLKGNFTFLALTHNWESEQGRPRSSLTLQDKVIRRLQVKPLCSYSTSLGSQSKLNDSAGHKYIDHPLSLYYSGF